MPIGVILCPKLFWKINDVELNKQGSFDRDKKRKKVLIHLIEQTVIGPTLKNIFIGGIVHPYSSRSYETVKFKVEGQKSLFNSKANNVRLFIDWLLCKEHDRRF